MPNWCSTSYRIVGKKEEVNELFAKIKQLDEMEKPLVENGFGNLWLGCLVTILGGNWYDIYCRGYISDFSLDDGILSIETETAWAEMSEVRHYFEKVYPALKIYYYEEESGCEIYQTNDSNGIFFSSRYIFDDQNGEGMEYFDKAETLVAFASKAMGVKLKSIKEFEEAVGETEGFSYHVIKIIDD